MIVILFTGGTISMRHDASAGGAVPSLRGPDILQLVPTIRDFAEIEVDDWAAHPGPHMTIERMWELRGRIVKHLEREDVNGVVVTHGTDALEETAYLLARSIRTTESRGLSPARCAHRAISDGTDPRISAVRSSSPPMKSRVVWACLW